MNPKTMLSSSEDVIISPISLPLMRPLLPSSSYVIHNNSQEISAWSVRRRQERMYYVVYSWLNTYWDEVHGTGDAVTNVVCNCRWPGKVRYECGNMYMTLGSLIAYGNSAVPVVSVDNARGMAIALRPLTWCSLILWSFYEDGKGCIIDHGFVS